MPSGRGEEEPAAREVVLEAGVLEEVQGRPGRRRRGAGMVDDPDDREAAHPGGGHRQPAAGQDARGVQVPVLLHQLHEVGAGADRGHGVDDPGVAWFDPARAQIADDVTRGEERDRALGLLGEAPRCGGVHVGAIPVPGGADPAALDVEPVDELDALPLLAGDDLSDAEDPSAARSGAGVRAVAQDVHAVAAEPGVPREDDGAAAVAVARRRAGAGRGTGRGAGGPRGQLQAPDERDRDGHRAEQGAMSQPGWCKGPQGEPA